MGKIDIYYETRQKVLNKDIATSILVSNELLKTCNLLTEVAKSRDNIYYLVNGTNTVIMHVEEGFCILCDYIVKGKIIPELTQKEHYAVYQSSGRDWIKNSATGQLIGYDIKYLIKGNRNRPQGTTLDHEAETFDEREKNKIFSTNNINKGSHRVKLLIQTQDELCEIIDKIQKNKRKGGLFIK